MGLRPLPASYMMESLHHFQKNIFNWKIKAQNLGTSLVVWWLGLCASNAGGTGSSSGRETKIPCVLVWPETNKI